MTLPLPPHCSMSLVAFDPVPLVDYTSPALLCLHAQHLLCTTVNDCVPLVNCCVVWRFLLVVCKRWIWCKGCGLMTAVGREKGRRGREGVLIVMCHKGLVLIGYVSLSV